MDRVRIIFLFSILLTTVIVFTCKAQEQSGDENSLKKDTWALEFGIGSNLTLTSFQGATIAAKYQISESNALRAGIILNGNFDNGSGSTSGTYGDSSSVIVPTDNSNKTASVSFVIQYLWYMNPKGPVHFYAGVGPSVSYNYSYYSSFSLSVSNNNNQITWIKDQYTSSSTHWAAGGSAIAGVEWFAAKWISLHADYSESILYQWGASTRDYNYIPSDKSIVPLSNNSSIRDSGWSLSNSRVTFGVDIYI